jgi:HPt (histidine-containing phosphotransfer) domain-containing protein
MNAEQSSKSPSASGGRTGRIECSLDNDPRLLACVEAVVAHAAHMAGLPDETKQLLGSTVFGASRQLAHPLNGSAAAVPTRLIVDEFSDRLEISIDSASPANTEGLCKQLAAHAGERIRCESQDGRIRVTLLKPCGVAKSGATC